MVRQIFYSKDYYFFIKKKKQSISVNLFLFLRYFINNSLFKDMDWI